MARSPDAFMTVEYDPDSHMLHLVSADEAYDFEFNAALEVEGELWTLEDADEVTPDGEISPGETFHIRAVFTEHRLSWDLRATLSDDEASLTINSELHNTGDSPAVLDWVCPVFISADHGGATMPPDAVYMQSSGTTSPSRMYRTDDQEAPRESEILLHIASVDAGRAFHFGFTSFDVAPPRHLFSCNSDGAGVCQELACICDFGGWTLPPGKHTHTETLVIEARVDLYESLDRWADRVHDHYKPDIWPGIPAGWLGWSWVDSFNIETYEDVVIRNAGAIRRRLCGFHIDYVWVIIGNIADGLPGNWLQWNEDAFPSGHEWLVKELEKMDFRLGLWCGLFYVTTWLDDIVEGLDGAFLKKNGEPAVVLPKWRYGRAARVPEDERPGCYAVDPTHPKGEQFLRDIFQTYRDWGVRYYMLDFLNAASNANRYDDYHDHSLVPGLPIMRRGLEIATETAGPETYTLSSSGPHFACCPYVSAARMGNDFGEGRAINPESYFYPATFVINDTGAWTGHRRASDNLASTAYSHRKLFINDSCNVMTVDKPIPVSEARITTTLFGICGGPIMLGDDIDRISEERLALIKKVFPRTPEAPRCVDLFDTPEPDYPKVFHLHVDAGWGEWEIVAIVNYGDASLHQTVALEKLGLDPDSSYRVWEFWNEAYLGTISGQLQAQVPRHAARVYRIIPDDGTPAVIGTDMHVLQGRVELADVRWDAQSLTLSGTASRPRGETGNVFVNVPPGLAVENPQGLWIGKDPGNDNLIIRIALRFTGKPREWEIQFSQYE